MVASGDRRILFKLGLEADAQAKTVLNNFAQQAAQVQNRISAAMRQQPAAQSDQGGLSQKQFEQAEKFEAKLEQEREKSLAKILKNFEKEEQAKQKELDRLIALEKKYHETLAKEREQAAAKQEAESLKYWTGEAKRIDKSLADAEVAQSKLKASQDSLKTAAGEAFQGSMQFARGLAIAGIAGEKDSKKILDGLLKIQAAYDMLSGGVQLWQKMQSAVDAYSASVKAAAAVEQSASAARALGGGTGAAGKAAGAAAEGAGLLSRLGSVAGPVALKLGAIAGPAALAAGALGAFTIALRAFDKPRERTGTSRDPLGLLDKPEMSGTAVGFGISTEARKDDFQRDTESLGRLTNWLVDVGSLGLLGSKDIASGNKSDEEAKRRQDRYDKYRAVNQQMEEGRNRGAAEDFSKDSKALSDLLRDQSALREFFADQSPRVQEQLQRRQLFGDEDKKLGERGGALEAAQDALEKARERYSALISAGINQDSEEAKARLAEVEQAEQRLIGLRKDGHALDKQASERRIEAAKTELQLARDKLKTIRDQLKEARDARKDAISGFGDLDPAKRKSLLYAMNELKQGRASGLRKEHLDLIESAGDAESKELLDKEKQRRGEAELQAEERAGTPGAKGAFSREKRRIENLEAQRDVTQGIANEKKSRLEGLLDAGKQIKITTDNRVEVVLSFDEQWADKVAGKLHEAALPKLRKEMQALEDRMKKMVEASEAKSSSQLRTSNRQRGQ